jgi:hypothetical protein
MTGRADESGVSGKDRGPIQSALDIHKPIQKTRTTVLFSQNTRLARPSTTSALFARR